MITALSLKNFRCFDTHTIELPEKTLLVGKNNAGKSSCVEALRLISIVTERLGSLTWKSPPYEAGLPIGTRGASPSLDSIAIHRDCLFHRYSEPPAVVSATFKTGARLDVYIGTDLYIHAVVYDKKGRAATSRSAAMAAGIPRVSILPQIGPLPEEERRLNDDYVRRNLQTSLSSLHFRNQLRIFKDDYFAQFDQLVATTWPGLRIKNLEIPPPIEKEGRLALVIRDGDFSAEAAWMGHGLQMWLQTIWFLTRNQQSSVLILDEPDVYMHADLQRKLVRMLLRDNRQFIIATHSPEMLAEVDPESVVILDRSKSRSRPATSSKAVQRLLVHVGSVHNLSLARLALHRRILFVEGEDIGLLKLFQNRTDPDAERPIDIIPNTDIKGWSGWPAVLTFARFLRENANDEFEIYCVLDRDYHTDDEVEERLRQAKDAAINLHIWNAKELENYAINSGAIARFVSKKAKFSVAPADVETAISAAVEARKEETFDSFSEAIRQQTRSGADKSNAKARPIFNTRWSSSSGRHVVSGKQLLSDLSGWAQKNYNVSIPINPLLREFEKDDISPEVADFIKLVTAQ